MRRRDDPIARRSLREFDVSDVLCFLAAWSPPTAASDRELSRWTTWREFLGDYESIRAQLLERWHPRPDGRRIFAESVRTFVQREGLETLEAMTGLAQLKDRLERCERTTDA